MSLLMKAGLICLWMYSGREPPAFTMCRPQLFHIRDTLDCTLHSYFPLGQFQKLTSCPAVSETIKIVLQIIHMAYAYTTYKADKLDLVL